MKSLSLHKLRQQYRSHRNWYQKHANTLSSEPRLEMESVLNNLNTALREGDKVQSNHWAGELEKLAGRLHKKKPFFVRALEVVGALCLALCAAIVIRQMWFELYQIPTGSMRPTFREKDRLIVTKTSLGLNIPMSTGHLWFSPENVQRGGVVIWKGDGLPYLSLSDRFLGILPYNKRFIKRLVGKPGDTLYFYGGKIWGFDRDGKAITDLREQTWNIGIEHLPFSHFEGMVDYDRQNGEQTITFNHFNQPVGRLRLDAFGTIHPEVYDGNVWVREVSGTTSDTILQFGERFGIEHFAKVRMLTPELMRAFPLKISQTSAEDTIAYLQIFHHPTLSSPIPPLYRNAYNSLITQLQPQSTFLPLKEQHIDALRKGLYTSRFVVSSGYASPYDVGAKAYPLPNAVPMAGIPDGTYEFYYGKGYSVRGDGHLTELPSDHPLQPKQLEELIKLFNMGIEFNTRLQVSNNSQGPLPSRYAYWNDGTLFVGGGAIGSVVSDETLRNFVDQEEERAKNATAKTPYFPFIDAGPPLLTDGTLDQKRIAVRGLQIPEGHYLVLGDNHSRSADSRIFGFLPEENLEGTPSLILWPAPDRWGPPSQPGYQWVTLPRIVVWSIALLLFFGWRLWIRREAHRPFHPTAP